MALPNITSSKRAMQSDFSGLNQLFKGISDFPALVKLLETQSFEIKEIRRELAELIRCSHGNKDEGWLDAKGAATYLGVSPNTFDKYRYHTAPKIRGYRLGGKILYQRSDLDNFVKLFETKSNGLS